MSDDFENNNFPENNEENPQTYNEQENDIISDSGESLFDSEPGSAEPAEQNSEIQDAEYVEAEPVVPPYGQNANPNSNPYGSQGINYNTGANQYYNSANPYNQQPRYQSNYAPAPAAPEKKSKKGLKTFLAIIALILVFALGAGTMSIFKGKNVKNSSEGTTASGDTAELTINDTPTTGKTSKSSGTALTPAEIAVKVRESNVGIVVYRRGSNSASGEGSGIIMGEDSTGTYTYIITCAHVIDESGVAVTVQTEEGESYDAEIVGYDTRTDIGVVKIKKTGLQAAEFGDSDALSIGDPVYAVGNPGGVEFFGSFTGGFISAINRPISSEIGYTMKCIQHDASINPGNSGGMLVNQYGQVVGINSQKIASTEYEGMGFAIPITSAKEIIDDLIQHSYVTNRPKLGISYYPLSASTTYNMIAQIKGLPAGTLIIGSIDSDSSLADTNVQKYDMITKVNGKELSTADVLLELIDDGKVGDTLKLTICRVGNNYEITEFEVEATLVEDKGNTEQETTTTAVDPFQYFYNYGNGYGYGDGSIN